MNATFRILAAAEPESDWLTMPLLLGPGLLVIGAVLVYLFVASRRRARRGVADETAADLWLDVSELPEGGPPQDSPRLEFYHVPVRLAVLVLAPVGRGGTIPPNERLPEVVDRMVPGLMQVLSAHRPLFKRWPAQLSSQGFAQLLFSKIPLPGDRGKGTPWCSIAGKVEVDGEQYLVGMVCCAEGPNSLGQVLVDRPGGWLDVLRVRSE